MDYSTKIFNKNIDIYNSLMDDESKALYRANIIWRLLGEEEFYKCVAESDKNKDFGKNELMNYEYFNNPDYRGIVLFGCGKNSMEFYYQIKALGYKVIAFCDNNSDLIGKEHMGLKIVSAEELVNNFSDAFIIITPSKHRDSIYNQLINMGFNANNICIPITGFACIYNESSEQYFDKNIVKPDKNEVFIDAGAYDGNTILYFMKWCNNNYSHIYAFDPSPDNIKKCRKTLNKNNVLNVSFIEAGVYSENKTLYFDNSLCDSGASKVSQSGGMSVKVVAIDNVLNGSPATFIKMDIEGSELEALKGARKTIEKYHPKLAICIYHKPEDIITIPNYIKEINSDYKFYIRKYTPHHGEMVLYAV